MRTKLKILSKNKAKMLGVYNFNNMDLKYELFLPMNKFWLQYISHLLGQQIL